LEFLSKPSSSVFWSRLVVSTTTLFYLAPSLLRFFLLLILATKPLSPEYWIHWINFCTWFNSLQFLSRFAFLQKLHYEVSVFLNLELPSPCASKEPLIWKVWSPEEMSRGPWHFIEQVRSMIRSGMPLSLHCGVALMLKPACLTVLLMHLS